MFLDNGERLIVYYAIIGPSILSALGCFFIIFMYCKFSSLRSTSYTLILILTCFDLLNAAGFLIPTFNAQDSSINCQVQAALISFSAMGSVIWTTYMGFFMLSTVKGNNGYSLKTSLLTCFGVVIVCLAVSIIPFFAYGSNSYGRVQGWCWIEENRKILRVCLFFGPILIITSLNFIIYLRAKQNINDLIKDLDDSTKGKLLKNKLIMYPLIIFICYIPYTVKVIIEIFRFDINELYFTMASGMMRCFHGFFNLLVYGINKTVIRVLKKWINEKKFKEDNDIISFLSTENWIVAN